MRFLLVSVLYFGLPLWAAVTNPFNTGIESMITDFARFVAVQTTIVMLFIVAALLLGRILCGQWVWNDTVEMPRHSNHIVPDTDTACAELKEELDAQYRAWLFHK